MSGLDEDYWKEKGWNKRIYYFDCKINILKRMIAMLNLQSDAPIQMRVVLCGEQGKQQFIGQTLCATESENPHRK
jgi:hypothetical protein